MERVSNKVGEKILSLAFKRPQSAIPGRKRVLRNKLKVHGTILGIVFGGNISQQLVDQIKNGSISGENVILQQVVAQIGHRL